MYRIDLHRNLESDLELVDFSATISKEEQNSKIKLTYERALYEIYQLSKNPDYTKYFHKILNLDPIQGDPFLLGAAVNKVSGKIFVIVKNETDLNASVIKWFQNEWKIIDNQLQEEFLTHNSKRKEAKMCYKSYFHTFGWKYLYEGDWNENIKSHEKSSYFSHLPSLKEKNILSIEGGEVFIGRRKFFHTIESSKSSPGCFTISYDDIVESFSRFRADRQVKSSRNV